MVCLCFVYSGEWRDTIDIGLQGYHWRHNLRKQLFRSGTDLCSWGHCLIVGLWGQISKGTPIRKRHTYILSIVIGIDLSKSFKIHLEGISASMFKDLSQPNPCLYREGFRMIDPWKMWHWIRGVTGWPRLISSIMSKLYRIPRRQSSIQTLLLGGRDFFTWIIQETILCLVLELQGCGVLMFVYIRYMYIYININIIYIYIFFLNEW